MRVSFRAAHEKRDKHHQRRLGNQLSFLGEKKRPSGGGSSRRAQLQPACSPGASAQAGSAIISGGEVEITPRAFTRSHSRPGESPSHSPQPQTLPQLTPGEQTHVSHTHRGAGSAPGKAKGNGRAIGLASEHRPVPRGSVGCSPRAAPRPQQDEHPCRGGAGWAAMHAPHPRSRAAIIQLQGGCRFPAGSHKTGQEQERAMKPTRSAPPGAFPSRQPRDTCRPPALRRDPAASPVSLPHPPFLPWGVSHRWGKLFQRRQIG